MLRIFFDRIPVNGRRRFLSYFVFLDKLILNVNFVERQRNSYVMILLKYYLDYTDLVIVREVFFI